MRKFLQLGVLCTLVIAMAGGAELATLPAFASSHREASPSAGSR